jgi:hypothetical protein
MESASVLCLRVTVRSYIRDCRQRAEYEVSSDKAGEGTLVEGRRVLALLCHSVEVCGMHKLLESSDCM